MCREPAVDNVMIILNLFYVQQLVLKRNRDLSDDDKNVDNKNVHWIQHYNKGSADLPPY